MPEIALDPDESAQAKLPSPGKVRRRPGTGWFRRFAHRVSILVGAPTSFFVAVAVILVWGVSGPIFHYSDTWQLVINTGTTIVTFLMVFLIQSTQNRDASAIHLKLDELIRATASARNGMLALEGLSDKELAELEKEFEGLSQQARSVRESLLTPDPEDQRSPMT
jgi:low affinity Fe/Cu permease